MKKCLFFIISLLFLNIGNTQTIVNGDFENWQTVNYFDYPSNWIINTWMDQPNSYAQQSTDAQHLNYSILLSTLNVQDVSFAIYGIPAEEEFMGLPFNQLGDTLHFWYKAEYVGSDFGMMLLMLYNSGNVVDSVFLPINASASWTHVKVPVNPLLITPDSMFLGFISSAPNYYNWGGNPQVGSWLMLDQVYFTLGNDPTPITVPNYSFENWETASAEDPVGWKTTNSELSLVFNDTVNVTKTTDAHSGTYAAKLEVFEFFGDRVKAEIELEQSINFAPEKLTFSFKYIPMLLDTVRLDISFFKNGTHVGNFGGASGNQQLTWTTIEIDIANHYSETPDEIHIFFSAGENPGSVLYIDDIRFSCISPKNLYAEYTTSSDATLYWSAGANESSWEVEWGIAGFMPGTGTTQIVNNISQLSISGISDMNQYEFYVKSICDIGDSSSWAGPASLCKAIGIPVAEGFEMYPNGSFPHCWTKIVPDMGQIQVSDWNMMGFNSPKYLSINYNYGMNPSIAGIVTPMIQSNLNDLYISLYAMNINQGNPTNIQIGTMSNPGDYNTFNPLLTQPLNHMYQNISYYFDSYAGNDKYIGIFVSSLNSFNNTFVAIDEITIDVVPSCVPPVGLGVTNLTPNSADLTWNPGSQTLWNLEWGHPGFMQGTGQFVSGLINPVYHVSNLMPNQWYSFYVQADCGIDGISPWAGPFMFSTPCGVMPVPFTETFDGWMFPPSCWSKTWGNEQWNQNYNAGAYGNSYQSVFAEFYNFNNNSPFDLETFTFDLSSAASPQLMFDWAYARYDDTYFDQLDIYISSNGGNTYSLLESMSGGPAGTLSTTTPKTNYFVPQPSEWQTKMINLPGGTNKIKFTATSGWGNNLYLDNIFVGEPPTCFTPQNIQIQNNTGTSVDVVWQPGNDETMWNLIYVLSGQDIFTHGTQISGITSPTYTINGLSGGMYYDVIIQSDCGSGDLSFWTNPQTFQMQCNPQQIPYVQDFESSWPPFVPFCTSVQNPGYGNQWQTSFAPGYGFNSNVLIYPSHYDNPANTWFYTHGIQLDGGITYSISFNYGNNTTTWVEKLRVFYGDMPDQMAMSNQLFDFPMINQATAQLAQNYFTPSVSGVYYFGFHCYSDANQYFLYVDDIVIDVAASCLMPTQLTADNISTNSAELMWANPGNASEFQIEWGPAYFNPGTGNQASSLAPSFALQNVLTPASQYKFYVRAVCSVGDTSAWAGPYYFYTDCDLVSTFIEDFDGLTDFALPICWSKMTSTGQAYTYFANAFSPPNNLDMYAQDPQNQVVVSMRPVSNAGDDTHLLRFRTRSNMFPVNTFEVGYLTDPNDHNSFVLLQPVSHSSGQYQEITIYPGTAPGNNTTFAFRHTGLVNTIISIDDVIWEPIPSCPAPYSLGVMNVTEATADLIWSYNGYADGFQVEYGWAGFMQGFGTTDITTGNQYSVTGLSPASMFDFYVRSICDAVGGDTSTWAGPFTFSTPVSCPYNTVYGQTPNPIQNFLWSAQEFDRKVHQSFSGINEPYNALHIWGTLLDYNFGNPVPCYKDSIDVEIGFYQDNMGSIGSLLTSFIVKAYPYFTQINGTSAFEFHIQFPQILNYTEGWFSIQSVNSPDCYTLFANTSNPAAQGYVLRVQNMGADTIPFPPLAFCLQSIFHTVTYLDSPGGTISGQTIQNVIHGGSTTQVEAIPDECYEFVQWSDGIVSNPRTDYDIMHDITVYAFYQLKNISTSITDYFCEGETYVFGSHILSMPGNYQENLLTPLGCDSIVYLQLFSYPSYTFIENMEVCTGDIFSWRGLIIDEDGIYYDSLTTVSGCDSVFVLNIIFNPYHEFIENHAICSGDVFTWRGNDYNVEGTYYDNFLNVYGCDSVYVLNLSVIPSTSNTTTLTECDSYIWAENGQTYTTSGVYSEVTGCHTEILDLTVIISTSNTTVASACDSYLWSYNGQTYTATGVYEVVTGCHTETLDLTITPSTSNTTVVSICNIYTWPVNGQTYTMSGIYTHVVGCHTEILDLTIIAGTTNTTTITACETYTWAYNGVTYTSTGIYTENTGCHSEILDLTIILFTSNSITIDVCDSYNWALTGLTYTTSGIYSQTTGCHTEFLFLTVTPTTSNTTTLSVCDTYTWPVNGMTYTVTGMYTDVTGCHTEILDLTITASTTNTTVASACDFYVWAYNGQTYTATGVYEVVTGCHTEILDLTITISTTNTTVAAACDSYVWAYNGLTYTVGVIYTEVNGCHTEILDLTITTSTSNTTVVSICNIYTWPLNGQTYTASGTYTYVVGCHTEILDLTSFRVQTQQLL
jgi:hypothetical protein